VPLLALSLLVASQAIQPYKVTLDLSIAKSVVGSNEYSVTADGTVTSFSTLAVGSIKIDSRINGKFEGGKLVRYSIAQKGQPPEFEWTLENGRLKGKRGTAPFDVAAEAPDILFGNLHPAFTATMLRKYDVAKGGKQKVKAFIVDGGGFLEADVERTGTKQIKRGGSPEAAFVWKVSAGPVAMDIVSDKDGNILGENVPSQSLSFQAKGLDGLFVDPMAAYPELSQPMEKSKLVKGESAAMRDGVKLVHDRIGPDREGKFPVILVRTPYGRGPQMLEGEFWAKRGYVFVSQDCRGREDSEGEWDPFVNERKDGYDTIEWIAKQPWCDGNVGMIGGSYSGLVQWQAAVEQPKALKAIIPQVSPPDAFTNIPYEYGAFTLYQNVWWANIVKDKKSDMSQAQAGSVSNADLFLTLPLSKVDDKVLGRNIPFFDKWLERDSIKAFKGFDQVSDLGKVKIPALHISGWWDGDGIGTKLNWEAMRRAGRKNQWLIYGPWSHAFNTTTSLGDVDYGPSAILELNSVYLRWFDTWLKGKSVGQEKQPKVKVFLTKANVWLTGADWPLPSTVPKKLFLSSSGPANGKTSMGTLVDAAEASEPDRYLYNPASAKVPDELAKGNPTPSTKVTLEEGDRELFFKTAPLDRSMSVFGPIEVDFWFSTTARDADFFATLVDIDPKGEMRVFGMPGKLRASYLSGNDKRQPLTPGKTYRAKIRLWDAAHLLEKGHRLGLMINSDMFPMVNRNFGTAEPIMNATKMVSASHTIYHDLSRPSSLSFFAGG